MTLIERNVDHVDVDSVPAAHWRLGDACELSLLESVHLEEFDVVVAATGDDKANVVLSLLAKTEFAVPRVVARVNDPRNEWLFTDAWGVDVAVSTPRILASLVEEAVAVGDLVRLMEFRKGQANLVEITLPDDTPWGGKPVRRLQLPRDAALVTILRGRGSSCPPPTSRWKAATSCSSLRSPRWRRSCVGCCCRNTSLRRTHRTLGSLDRRVGRHRRRDAQRPAHRDASHAQPAGLVGVVEQPLHHEPRTEYQHPGQGRGVERQHRTAYPPPAAVLPARPAPQVTDQRPSDQHRHREDHRPQQRGPDAQQKVALRFPTA
ncbi:trkA-N domain protein [Mycobacterium xenopi 4042]|uniref:TrkA-N domain protein n=1 Tax=Mycobacterium xenopi 4042 TaxID=1299334 RepID=X8CE97_MYCXE|nr:trkA-N domain protein [Mycobacterium xenopi 4042]